MTYPDKTMYPVASKNDKDFRNLMDVYLDAVLYLSVSYTHLDVYKRQNTGGSIFTLYGCYKRRPFSNVRRNK